MKQQASAIASCRFRYRGYRQNDGIREFAFEDVGVENTTHPVVVNVDVQLLLKHHVHFQDAPRLCIELLSGNPLTDDAAEETAIRIVVSDDDLTNLLAKVEDTPVAKKRKKV